MEFKEHLKQYLSEKEIEELIVSLDKDPFHGVLLNPQKMSDEKFLSLFPNVTKHPIVKHAFIYDKNKYELGKSIYHMLGCFYLQEPSAMLPAYLLNASNDDLVLDMCAAPGGKTVQTSFLLNNKGLIIANDLSRSRASIIVENVERLGLGNVIITNNDLSLIYQKYLNKFDKIILDAPCSGSGMFRKEEKMEDDWSYGKVLKFAETQKQLISIAYDMLKPGGLLMYSTCSFSKEEDEDVISHLLTNSDAEIIELNNPLYYKNKNSPLGVHLLPSIFPGEGHYLCLIKKPGICPSNGQKESKNSSKFGLDFKEIYNFGNFIFGLNHDFKSKNFNILRLGVKVGELIKNEIKYDYHYAHYISSFDNEVELNEEEVNKYLKGETISKEINKGWILLKYQGIPLDLTKSDGRIIKNHLPKFLRNKYKF